MTVEDGEWKHSEPLRVLERNSGVRQHHCGRVVQGV